MALLRSPHFLELPAPLLFPIAYRQKPPGANDSPTKPPTVRRAKRLTVESCLCPASVCASVSVLGSGYGPLLLCVRACRLVFVIPDGMSSIKIYLSDFS
ncbi:GM18644 [Drosophila sechellia]|uniref:GM18644 n=1 Tax=Drosophila sechellia TaxID=7238 RepID=B4I1Y8_DROSE|nr:GM18644 [Drosophila sechellia]